MVGVITNPIEIANIGTWLAHNADTYFAYVKPDMITQADGSQAIRFRWFDVDIAGRSYTVGVNIHYGGNFGGVWFHHIGDDIARDYHPFAAPQHNLQAGTLKDIRRHAKRDATALGQYQYSKIKNSYFGEFMEGNRSFVYHGRNSDKQTLNPI